MRVVVYLMGKMPYGRYVYISWDTSKRKKSTGRKWFSFRPMYCTGKVKYFFDVWEIYEFNIYVRYLVHSSMLFPPMKEKNPPDIFACGLG